MFKRDFFESNRRQLRANFDKDSFFIFTANGLLQRSASTTYPFRQDSNFWYLTGIDEADILLVMKSDSEYLLLPKRSDTHDKFNGKVDKDRLRTVSGIPEIYEFNQGSKKIKKEILKRKKAVTLNPLDAYLESAGFYTNPARQKLASMILDIKPSISLIDARQQIANLRMIKKSEEILAIEKAISITSEAFKKIKENISGYKTENEVIKTISSEFINHGAAGHAYDSIVAADKNACVLHYLSKDSPIKSGSLVLVDAGAEFCNYASDLTRTYSVSKPTPRQNEVFEAVMDIRNHALGLLKPGLALTEYELSVRDYAADILNKLKLKNQNVKNYYPHSTSHFLGLDVHDAGDYESVLKENMILTVEPGIYIEEESIGIRIEDNILITSDGYRNLSEKLPRELI